MYYWSMSLNFTLDSWLLSSCLTIYIPSYHKRYNFMVNLSGSYSFNVLLTNSYFVLFFKCFLQNSYMLPCFLLPSVRYYLAQLKGKIKILVRLWKTPFWLDSGNSKKMVKADSFYICFSSFPTILTLSSICFFLYYYVKSITLWNHQFTT